MAAKGTLGRSLGRAVEALQARELCDRDLLDRYTGGRDEAAFAALVRRHASRVLAACRRVLDDPADLDDAFQATFLVLLDKAKQVRWQPDLGGWLAAVAHRVAVRARSRAAHRRRHEARAPRPDAPESDLGWREACDLLHSELDRLPDKFRLPLLLCYLEGKSRDEAAAELSLTVAAVKSRLERGRNELRQRLRRHGVTLSAGLLAALVTSRAGAVSARLVGATLSAAAGPVPAGVAALVQGVTAVMMLSKLKLAAGLLLLAGLLGAALAFSRPATASSSAPPAAPADDAKPPADVEVAGRVLDAAGRPLAGAVVHLWADNRIGPETKTDAKGAFRLAVPAGRLPAGAAVVATADGRGPDWQNVSGPRADVELRLPADDLPLTGRVLDLEGRPVAGATLQVQNVGKPDLGKWIEARKKGIYPDVPRLGPQALRLPAALATDKQGRFRGTGFGRDRVVRLLVRGPAIQQMEIWAVTRAELPADVRRGNYGSYPAKFDLLAGPSRSIAGTVRDKATAKPIPGVTVGSIYYGNVYAKTDDQGRYKIDGVGKHDKYAVAAGGKLPYFNCTKMDIPDQQGLDTITVDFELEKGLVVRGRLREKDTGAPVRGTVIYRAFDDNPHLGDYTDIGKPQVLVDNPFEVKPDGSFTALAIPGKGALCVQARPTDRYRRNVPTGLKLGNLILEGYHTIVVVDVSEKDPKSLVCDITVETGRNLSGTLIDPDGKPVTGAVALGLPATAEVVFGPRRPLEKAEFRVGGLGDAPRQLFFVHPERKLAKLLTVGKDERGPLTVRLEGAGSLSGRVLTGEKPQAGAKVTATLSQNPTLYGKELPRELWFEYPHWSKLLRAEATTDEQGRFRLDGLVPGLKYGLRLGEDERLYGDGQDALTIEPGKDRPVGDFNTTPRPLEKP